VLVTLGLETGTDALRSDSNCPSFLSERTKSISSSPLPPDLAEYVFVSPLLTFYHLVISKVQIEEEKHMQSSKGPTQDEPLGMAHGARHQHSNLGEMWRLETR